MPLRRSRSFRTFVLLLLLSLYDVTACKPAAQNLGIFGKSRLNTVLGQDGCTPIQLDERTVMWTFGDTIFGSWRKNLSLSSTFNDAAVMKGMLDNSLAFTGIPTDATIRDPGFLFLTDRGRPVSFLRHRANEPADRVRLWATGGIRLDDTVYVYHMLIRITPAPAPAPFTLEGMGLARWRVPPGWRVGGPVNFERLGILFEKEAPTFGDSVIRRDAYLYLAGHVARQKNPYPGAAFARVTFDRLTDRAAYEFLTAAGTWSPDLREAGAFFGDVLGELSLSYNRYLGRYVIIYCSSTGAIHGVPFRDFAELSAAAPRILALPPQTGPDPRNPLAFYYSGKEIWSSRKALYAVYMHPLIYQPILLRIPYPLLW